MVEQATLFNQPEILVTDPNTRDEDDDRLAGQNKTIYELLMLHGQMSNRELSNISLKYTSRISDIRRWLEKRGQTIICIRGTGGLNYYEIVKFERGNDGRE